MIGREIRLLLLGLLAGSLLGLAYILGSNALSRSRQASSKPELGIGKPAPEFSLEALDGSTASLAQYRGRPLVLNFWATWCSPCKAEMPMLGRYAEQYGPELAVVGVNYGESRAEAQGFVDANGIRFPILLDPGSSTGPVYLIRAFPTTFFIDKDGVLRSMHVGQLSEDLLNQYLKTIGL